MENEELKTEKVLEKKENQKISTPVAIIVAGIFIMVAILLTNSGSKVAKEKSLSEQVGVNKEKFTQCLNDTDLTLLKSSTDASAESAMKNLPNDQRGTPYSVIVGKNGSKAEIRGAYLKEDVLKLIKEVSDGKVTAPYTGEVPTVSKDDHIIGNIDAPVVVIEYSDLECPYCKRFGGVMKEVIAESNGQVAWVYRHWIVHQSALSKTAAAECVAKLKGEDAFWKYIDLVFGLMKTADDAPVTDNL